MFFRHELRAHRPRYELHTVKQTISGIGQDWHDVWGQEKNIQQIHKKNFFCDGGVDCSSRLR